MGNLDHNQRVKFVVEAFDTMPKHDCIKTFARDLQSFDKQTESCEICKKTCQIHFEKFCNYLQTSICVKRCTVEDGRDMLTTMPIS